jgi:hypothetical protein
MNFEKGSTQKARSLVEDWITEKLSSVKNKISIGLPEYDDRQKKWRVSLHSKNGLNNLIGEIFISQDIKAIVETTDVRIIKKRIAKDSIKEKKNYSPRKNCSCLRPSQTK